MKIQKITIHNFRNIVDFEKEINGASILLLGDNTVGKSNFLKALQICLGNMDLVGVDPITKGEKQAFIEVVTDDAGNKYNFKCKFEIGKDKPKLTVKQPNGLRTTAKSTIGAIVGEISFDIERFVEDSKTDKGRKNQVETFKSFLPTEIQEELRKYENKNKALYEDRTQVNRDIKRLEGAIKESKVSELDKKKYFIEENTEKLDAEMQAAMEENKDFVRGTQAKKDTLAKAEQCMEAKKQNVLEIERLKNEIAKVELKNKQLDEEQDGYNNKVLEIAAWLKKNPEKDVTALQARIKAAYDHNLMHAKVAALMKQEVEYEELLKESENLTVQLDASKEAIISAIKNDIDSPLAELTYDEDALLYNGRIVSDSTMSTAEIMELGFKMMIARNPNAKVLFVEHGESLGAAKLKSLMEMANKNGYQIFLEQVQRGQEELTIEIMPEI